MLIHATEIMCFVSHDAVVEEHGFHCYKVVVSIKGTFTTTLNGLTLENVSGYVLGNNVSHASQAPDTSVLVYMIEIESRLGHAIRDMLGGNLYVLLTPLLATTPFQQLLATGTQALQHEHALAIFANDVIQALFPAYKTLEMPLLDARIYQIINYIDDQIDQPLLLKVLAQRVNLSPDRVRHLFDEQVGAPISQYILWKRIKAVVQMVAREEMELGKAALRFGFFDQSHFGRVFKRIFGSTPRYFLKKTPYIILISPSV